MAKEKNSLGLASVINCPLNILFLFKKKKSYNYIEKKIEAVGCWGALWNYFLTEGVEFGLLETFLFTFPAPFLA